MACTYIHIVTARAINVMATETFKYQRYVIASGSIY